MILRRLSQSLKTQNWTAIWIEFILLVVGVFLGIQVANWNSERADRSAETRHLEEIAEDLRADVAVFDLIRTSALLRISSIDYILGETRGVSRPKELNMPSGEVFDMPVGIPILESERNNLLTRANTVRISMGNRTGFEALIGAGGMQTIRNRQISRKIQQYYASMDDLVGIQTMLRQIRNDGTKIGYSLGLSTFGEIDEQKLIAIVRSDASYASYLRTVREWAAVHLGDTNSQKQQALDLLADIDKYLGKEASAGK